MLEEPASKRRLILFVDDDPTLLRLGRLSLERAGYDCIGAPGGQEGLAQARACRPDLILLDYMMPDLNGKEVFQQLLASGDARLQRTPVVMLTARTNNYSEQRELLEQGLAAYLHKPFGYHELLNVIDNVLVASQIKERNRLLEEEARRSFICTVRMLINLLFIKDPYTGKHSNATAELAEGIALCYGLPAEQALFIKLGALLHDVGKIGVSESILRKPAALTADEVLEMRRHVTHGEQTLRDVPRMEAVRAMIHYHHEWWDGRGYPTGLRGAEIPLGARIIAVADAYDAMTSDRPYRRQLPLEVALERLRAGAGTQFDPAVVESLFQYLAANETSGDRELKLEFLEELPFVAYSELRLHATRR